MKDLFFRQYMFEPESYIEQEDIENDAPAELQICEIGKSDVFDLISSSAANTVMSLFRKHNKE